MKSAAKNREREIEAPAAPQASPVQHSTLREYFVTTVICTILALFVTTYVLHPMTVPTPSMVPTILVGDRLIIDKFTVRNGLRPWLPFVPSHEIRRRDVVVFKFPQNPEVLYVKRAIGLPGDRFEVRDKVVYINGKPLQEEYKYHSDPAVSGPHGGQHFFSSGDFRRDSVAPFVIPARQYFMMGDNRDDSADSRYWGTLPEDLIVGRPLFVFWSYADDSDAYLKSGVADLVKLYASRVIFFFTKTRWSRIGKLIR
ncbi:MAG: signal peptidase I [Acidobacteria bacterium]|nr:signal peptidase I [Acidobacteriota bacterium]